MSTTLSKARSYKGKTLYKSETGKKYYVTDGGNKVYVTSEMIEKAKASKGAKTGKSTGKKAAPAIKAKATKRQ